MDAREKESGSQCLNGRLDRPVILEWGSPEVDILLFHRRLQGFRGRSTFVYAKNVVIFKFPECELIYFLFYFLINK